MNKLVPILLKGLSLLPDRLLYLISDFLSGVILRIIPYRKKVIDKNLKAVFPDHPQKEIRRIRKSFYSFFCDLIVEGVIQLSISKEKLNERMKYSGTEQLDKAIEEGSSAIVITCHYSNWEWGFVGYSAASKHPLNGIYQKMSNETTGDVIVASRSRFGAQMIPMEETYDYIQKAMKEDPFNLGLIPDQTPLPDKGYWMEFLGMNTPVFRGPENLAKNFNLPVYFIDIKRLKQGYYSADVELLVKDPSEVDAGYITESFMKRLEAKIRQQPAHYLWSHKRWKHDMPSDLPERYYSKQYPPTAKGKIDY